jgi:hypothetical protein
MAATLFRFTVLDIHETKSPQQHSEETLQASPKLGESRPRRSGSSRVPPQLRGRSLFALPHANCVPSENALTSAAAED